MSDGSLTFTTAVRVIAGVHDGAADGRTPTHVTLAAGLTDLNVLVVEIADLTDAGSAVHANIANLSGGQKQRLALARALLHNSDIYIFDEATSNVDVESENDIMEVVKELAKTKTVLLISHRLANVVAADRIYVLKEGKVIEQGQHEELYRQQGYYQKLFQQQSDLEQFGKEAAVRG